MFVFQLFEKHLPDDDNLMYSDFFIETIKSIKLEKQLSTVLAIVDSCKSGSFLSGLEETDNGMIGISSTDAKRSTYGCAQYGFDQHETTLGNEFYQMLFKCKFRFNQKSILTENRKVERT